MKRLVFRPAFFCLEQRRLERLVMDNLASHKVQGVAGAIESAGADLWYLPAYSPDLNPIEKLWRNIGRGKYKAARSYQLLECGGFEQTDDLCIRL